MLDMLSWQKQVPWKLRPGKKASNLRLVLEKSLKELHDVVQGSQIYQDLKLSESMNITLYIL